MTEAKTKIEEVEDPIRLIGLALYALAWLTVCFQFYKYLRTGEWYPISLITVLQTIGNQWAVEPTQWFGVHKVLNFAPLSFVAFLVGACVMWSRNE